MERQIVRVGVGVYIFNNQNQVLLGLRKNSHGAETWCAPGGHQEFGETPEECARRETKEEVGIEIDNICPLSYTNDFFHAENKHYITLQFKASYKSGTVKVMEPEKCIKWEWFDWKDIPDNTFLSLTKLRSRLSFDEILSIKQAA